MTFSTQTLLPLTTYGTPSGNYNGSTPDFIGNNVPAANFYGGQGSGQTATIQLTGFVGTITLQASLNDWVEQAAWFDLEIIGDGVTPVTDNIAVTATGNFVWVRTAIVGFTAGVINSANLLY